MTTEVVNIQKETCDIFIGRPSKWGNPFIIGIDGTRSQVIQRYRDYILKSPELLKDLEELRDKRLGCFCKPKACHGDVLVDLLRPKLDI